ncbi:MAG: TIGR03016 family PEP-CTERM system-associated outer membrane protein [Propionivibrio sp.]
MTNMAMGTVMGTGMAIRLDGCSLIALGVSLGLLAAPAMAGEWTITPSISVTETATDNVDQVDKHRTSSLITDISPGIFIAGEGDRVKLRFDYRMHNLFYSDDSSRNEVQNSLNAFGTLEALENWFFVDAYASISQQNLSAFRGSTYSSSVDTNNSNNTTETSTYRISPYFKGILGTSTDYELRYNLSKTTADEGSGYDTETRGFSGRLAGMTRFSQFGWMLDGFTQKSKFDRGRDTEADLVRGTLTYRYDPQFRVSLIAGWESNDYNSLDMESHTIKGAGFEWAPTDRTLLSARREDRFFGNSDNITFTHRTAGSAWSYRQTKDAYTSTDERSGTVGTYYSLFDSLFSSAIPNPAARAAYINALLLSNGISPNAQLQGGFLTTGVTLQNRKELSFALIGVRNTVTFAATKSDTQAFTGSIGSGWYAGTDFSNVNNVDQTGASVNWSHKLTGLSTLTGTVARLESKSGGGGTYQTDETLVAINFLTRLGPKTTAGLGARRVEVDGTTNYTENVLTGTISHQF